MKNVKEFNHSHAAQIPSSMEIIQHGIHAATRRRNLSPLIRALELAMASPTQQLPDSATVFSCDSFCDPHLVSQLRLYSALKKIGNNNLNFLNLPISHYLTSAPNIEILKLANSPTRLLEANEKLLSSQARFLSCIPEEERLPSAQKYLRSLSQEYELLIHALEDDNWEKIYIDKLPFHELSLRDLSLTYKCSPTSVADNQKSFYSHYILSNKFNLWLLCALACEPLIGRRCYFMSFYTASTVFMYFCRQTGRPTRYFSPSNLDLKEFGLDKDAYMCITGSPIASTGLTKESTTSELRKIQASPAARLNLISIINKRFDGAGSHTYSNSQTNKSGSWADYNRWIQEQKAAGKKIVAAFTSSPDELIGQQLSYKHLGADLSHLPSSIFRDQEHWLEVIIRHFAVNQAESCLVVRMHPRLAADKRGLPESPYLKELWEQLNSLIGSNSNIRLVHPSDPISSYWLGLQSDLILNGWSTIGMEFAIKGKIVTNAFYKSPLGGAALYPVHTNTPPLKSTTDYLDRVTRLLKAIREGRSIADSDVITSEEAIKAFIAYFTAGLVNLDDPIQLHCQLASPSILTPQTLLLMMG